MSAGAAMHRINVPKTRLDAFGAPPLAVLESALTAIGLSRLQRTPELERMHFAELIRRKKWN